MITTYNNLVVVKLCCLDLMPHKIQLLVETIISGIRVSTKEEKRKLAHKKGETRNLPIRLYYKVEPDLVAHQQQFSRFLFSTPPASR